MEVYKNPINDFVANFVGTSNCIEKKDYANFGLEKKKNLIFINVLRKWYYYRILMKVDL